ncbi:MAG: flagellin [Armatimonadetes bacterium]|nr:flagellin [Armatimonadota bacterium]
MRTSLSQQIQSSLMFTSSASNKLMDAQNHAASGKRILRPSDDVPGTNRALTLRSGINTVNQFANNITVSKPLVDATENAMSDMVKTIRKIRDLTVKAATPDYTGTATETYISELNGFMSQLVDIANTKHGDQFIFSGTATATMPVQVNPGPVPDPILQPYIYVGNNGTRTTQVLSWVALPVNVPGDQVFNFDTGAGAPGGPGSTDVFTMVKNLRDAINSKDVTAISSQLTNIDANYNNVLSKQAQIGSWLGRMEGAKTTLVDTRDRLKEMLSDTEDCDLPEAIVNLKSQENVYQTALLITTRMLDLSLASLSR